jgi:anion-transporting  ArsA/GET3 family ATPase
MALAEALRGRRVIVCCGAGGVGKTTVSASIGLGLALEGRRAAVITIDPARRLASALGMSDLGDDPRAVSLPGGGAGGLWALQLDAKATFDRLVARNAPDEEARDRILQNRIYRHLSGAVAGSQEYMAVERLYELTEAGEYDTIVLDTPPARNALDFLDAPERMTRFIEGRALRMLVRPGMRAGRIGWRALNAGGAVILSLIERLTGGQLLRDVSDFLAGFEGMYQGFADRAQAVRRLLLSPDTRFVVVSGPGREPVEEAVALWRRLEHDDLPIGGMVLNRMHRPPATRPVDTAALSGVLAASGAAAPDDLAARVALTVEEERVRGLHDLDVSAGLAGALGHPPMVSIPEMWPEPVDLDGLRVLARALLGG